ncbi:MAG TPA: hypothetical protein VIK28_03480 [Sedimentisphaerales bacterium]
MVIQIRISPACFTPEVGILREVVPVVAAGKVTAVVDVVAGIEVVGVTKVVEGIEIVDGVFEHAAININPSPAIIIIIFLNIVALFIGFLTRM